MYKGDNRVEPIKYKYPASTDNESAFKADFYWDI